MSATAEAQWRVRRTELCTDRETRYKKSGGSTTITVKILDHCPIDVESTRLDLCPTSLLSVNSLSNTLCTSRFRAMITDYLLLQRTIHDNPRCHGSSSTRSNFGFTKLASAFLHLLTPFTSLADHLHFHSSKRVTDERRHWRSPLQGQYATHKPLQPLSIRRTTFPHHDAKATQAMLLQS